MTAENLPVGVLPQHHGADQSSPPEGPSEVERAIVTRSTLLGYGTEAPACQVALDGAGRGIGRSRKRPEGSFPDGV